MKWADRTVALSREGYSFILNHRLRLGRDAFGVRLLGQRVICMGGPQAAHLFYDGSRIERTPVFPRLVHQALLRKTLSGNSVSGLLDVTSAQWAQAASRWAQDGRIVLFDEAARLLTRAACEWAGSPLPRAGSDALAANLVAMVDASGTVGPRRLRARLARDRVVMWACQVIEDARRGLLPAARGSVTQTVAEHRDLDGRPLSTRAAAAELLNILKSVVAVAWYAVFVAHALHGHPRLRERVATAEEPMVGAFVDEVRRFYPFAPFLRARVRHDFLWGGQAFPAGTLVLLDIYGTNHDPDVWERPDVFDPDRFLLDRPPDPFAFVPQGGSITGELVKQAALFLSRLDYEVPQQDLTIPLERIRTRPRSGFVIAGACATVPRDFAAHAGRLLTVAVPMRPRSS